jgi:putative DNA primase/helicase
MVDFAAVAAAALAQCSALLNAWLPGGRVEAGEYHAAKKSAGGPGDSLSVNIASGKWQWFATGDSGGDLISLYATINKISQLEALRAIAADLNIDVPQNVPRNGQLKETPVSNGNGHDTERAAEPIPDDAPDPPAAERQTALYWYTDAAGVRLFAVARVELDDGHKTFRQWTWRHGRWAQKGYPAPRPLYNLPLLAIKPDAEILIVEGEKCADAAVSKGYAALTWSQGAASIDKSDWSALSGRRVLIWPDADTPGRDAGAKLAARLVPIASRVSVVDVDGQPEGWDIADLIADGADVERFIDQRRRDIPKAVPAEPKKGRKRDGRAPVIQAGDSAVMSWQQLGLACNSAGVPFPTLANASLILQQHPHVAKKIYYDSFRDKLYTKLDGKPREWCDADDRNLTVWIQQQVRLDKVSLKLVQQAVLHCAYLDRRNSFQDWVRSITWDGTVRRFDWLTDCCGAEGTEHHRAVASNWLVSMIARGFEPGCPAHHMPVLEGASGRGKSKTLEILGGCGDPDGNDWYAAISTEFGSKQFHENIQGRVVVEIPDMAGFGKALHAKIIAELSTRVDPYRVPWDRYSSDHPRRCIFAATSESSDYLDYPEGKRRYWPIRCGDINSDLLRGMRAQLFAEAYAAYRDGASWHEMPATTVGEQSARVSEDVWQRRIEDYLAGRLINQTAILERAHSSEILEAVGVPLRDQHDGLKRRVKKIMEMLGWEQKVDTVDGRSVKRWRPKA